MPDRGEAVAHVRRRVEADEVGAEQAFEQLLAPRQDAEGLERRKRDVQEKADARARHAFAQHGGHEHQLIVVDPDHVARPVHARDRVGEAAIRVFVRGPVVGVERNAIEQVVEQRPDHAVRKALVEAMDFFRGEMHRHDVLAIELRLHVDLLGGRQRGGVAGPANPHAGPAFVRAAQAGGEAARRRFERHRALIIRFHGDREAIRHDHQARARPAA